MITRLRHLKHISIILAFVSTGLAACSEATDQSTGWSIVNIGAPVNTAANEAFPAFSDDGLTMYFSRSSTFGEDGEAYATWWEIPDWNIYVTKRANLSSPWGEPQRLPDHINTKGTEHSVSFSPDGHWMYFSSDSLDTCGDLDILRAYRDDLTDPLGWGKPQNLGCHVNSPEHDVCVIYEEVKGGDSANLYFVSNRPGGLGSNDIWVFQHDIRADSFSAATAIPVLSSPDFEGHFEPTFGYIWAVKEGGLGGGDIWQSKRDAKGDWLPPINLGASINTEFEEQLPAPFDDGNAFYFPSDRPGTTGGLDIFLATRKN